MKSLSYYIFPLAAACASASEIKLRAVDETGSPLAGAQAMIIFPGWTSNTGTTFEGKTDRDGRFSGSGTAIALPVARILMDGYYESFLRFLPKDRDLDLTVVVRKVIQPIPLYALYAKVGTYSRENPQPGLKSETEYGFDLEVGEMMPPFGNGRTEDIHFRIVSEFDRWRLGERAFEESRRHPINQGISEARFRAVYGTWKANLEVTFPSPCSGFVDVTEDFYTYSEQQMPHRAPAEGYMSSKKFSTDSSTQLETDPMTWRKGCFLRTRVKRDASGKVLSAHYAKVVGDFLLHGYGTVVFTYAFNPTPNDRNLEFDRTRNLFPREKDGSNAHAR